MTPRRPKIAFAALLVVQLSLCIVATYFLMGANLARGETAGKLGLVWGTCLFTLAVWAGARRRAV